MILPDNNTPESPIKSRAGPPTEVEEDEQLPPPAYPGHGPSDGQPRYVDLEAQGSSSRAPLIPNTSTQIKRGEHAPTRFLKAFAVAILIYVFVGSLLQTIIAGARRHGGSPHRYDDVDDPHVDDPGSNPQIPSDPGSNPQIPYPIPSDGKVQECFSAASAAFLPVTSLHLPLSANLLYIFGRGDLTRGSITFQPTIDSSIPEGNVRVDIRPSSGSRAALETTNICLLEREGGERGVGILTPSKSKLSRDSLKFQINVLLPIKNGEILHLKALETNLPSFTHILTRLEGHVTFGSINLQSTNMPMHSDYLKAGSASVRTSNSKITGTYHVDEALTLKTTNELISADVALFHDAQRQTPTNLTMHTSNGHLSSKLSLVSTARLHAGGAFAVSAETRNGGLSLTVDAQPVDSTLALSARTNNEPATVRLHPAFEGAVTLATSNSPISLQVDEKARDPSARGRKRKWSMFQRTSKAMNGRVWWVSGAGEDFQGGSVSVQTSNAPATLSV